MTQEFIIKMLKEELEKNKNFVADTEKTAESYSAASGEKYAYMCGVYQAKLSWLLNSIEYLIKEAEKEEEERLAELERYSYSDEEAVAAFGE